jgi:precorrin-2 dehydrogenase/sirohydrochlorin ferrochelatase
MEAFPAFFPLHGRWLVIAGEGEAAEAKARLFEGSPARVVRLVGARAVEPAAYAGAVLAFVAGGDAAFRAAAAAAAKQAHTPVNVVDDPALCDFHTPAIVDRGQVVAAVGTAGAAPLLASVLRLEIEARIPRAAGELAALLGAQREAVATAFPDMAQRRAFLRSVLTGPAADTVGAGDTIAAERLLAEAIAAGVSAEGAVSIIEGAKTPDLICLRALRALGRADVVVFDPADDRFVADHTRREARRMTLSQASPEALAQSVREGDLVAVVAHETAPALAAALTRLGVNVETLHPAPAP